MRQSHVWMCVVAAGLLLGGVGWAQEAPAPANVDANALTFAAEPVALEMSWVEDLNFTMPDPRQWKPSRAKGLKASSAVASPMIMGDEVFLVALDRGSAEGTGYDTVRIDFTGKGDFIQAVSVPLKLRRRGNSTSGEIPPTVVRRPIDGGTWPTTVTGSFYPNGGYIYLRLAMMSAVAGEVTVAGRKHRVVAVDMDGDMRFSPPKSGSSIRDELIVDPQSKQPTRAVPGQPVSIGGQWMEIHVATDGSQLRLQPYAGPVGQVTVAADRWDVELVDDQNNLVAFRGGRSPVAVPAGTYSILRYSVAQEVEGGWNSLDVNTYGQMNGYKKVKIDAEGKTPLALGKLWATVGSSPRGTRNGDMTLYLSMGLRDAYGIRVSDFDTPRGRPAAPKVVVRNGEKVVYEATMEYG